MAGFSQLPGPARGGFHGKFHSAETARGIILFLILLHTNGHELARMDTNGYRPGLVN